MLRITTRPCRSVLAVALFVPLVAAQQPVDTLDLKGLHAPEGCTSIMVGRLATTDGSVITCHTCDGNYRTWVDIGQPRKNEPGESTPIYAGRMHNEFPGDLRRVRVTGEIPAAAQTYSFIDTCYPAMNEHQLGIGETTFGGRRELRSREGVFLIEELQRIALERTTTARAAIRLAGELATQYGYIDGGECLTFIDKKEVWQFEVLGPGKDHVGAVWAAQRVPDDHVGVSANIPRIGEIDLNDSDFFMASANVFALAQKMGWWDPDGDEPFKFWKVYGGRQTNHGRREWRVLSLAAPSLKLDPNEPELPFSVKADRKLHPREVMAWYRDTYAATEFDMTQNLLVKNRDGETTRSPTANPWMTRDQMAMYNALEDGAVSRERTIAIEGCSYSTVIQARDWLPDPIGGIVWFGFDNPAKSPRVPLFCGITDLPEDFKLCNQKRFSRDSAGWAARRVNRLASMKWGAAKEKVMSVVQEFEDRAFAELPLIEQRALELFEEDPEKAKAFLTRYSTDFARAMTARSWELGDELWMVFARGR